VVEFDGLRVELAGISGAASGDRFTLRPMRVAQSMTVAIDDTRTVAAALPVAAEPAAGNRGSLAVATLAVLDPSDPALRAPAEITFTNGLFVMDGQSFAPGANGATTITGSGWQLVLRGTPAEGDVIRVGDNAGAVGDNRGALALAGLASERLLGGGTATFSESYSQLVADVGVRTLRAEINADVQARLLGDAQGQRESISGVNLDEEAANLLRYQQAYQAAAQVITVANTLFETLLAAVRR
jgi:flagellar hook-associated protein 1 FlgK